MGNILIIIINIYGIISCWKYWIFLHFTEIGGKKEKKQHQCLKHQIQLKEDFYNEVLADSTYKTQTTKDTLPLLMGLF